MLAGLGQRSKRALPRLIVSAGTASPLIEPPIWLRGVGKDEVRAPTGAIHWSRSPEAHPALRTKEPSGRSSKYRLCQARTAIFFFKISAFSGSRCNLALLCTDCLRPARIASMDDIKDRSTGAVTDPVLTSTVQRLRQDLQELRSAFEQYKAAHP